MYAKVYAQMFDSSLREKWQAWVTFVALLALADDRDEVDMTVAALMARTGLPGSIVSEGIEWLERPDEHSRTPDEEGRRIVRLDEHRPWGWRIVNRGKYKRLRDNDARRDYFRDQKRVKRGVSTPCPPLSTTVHPCPPQTVDSRQETEDIESTHLSSSDDVTELELAPPEPRRAKRRAPGVSPLDAEWAETFHEVFWPEWLALGRECSKAAAFDAWQKTPHPDGQADFDRLHAAFVKSRDNWAAAQTLPRFIPHAATWLNDYHKNLLIGA